MKRCPGLRCVDFFCGGGGMSTGLSAAGIRVLGAIDNDPDCRETYKANHPDSRFIAADIARMHPGVLARKLQIRADDDNLLFVGCSPCQYWSMINADKNKSLVSRDLMRYFLRFVKYYRPGFVLVENVCGMLRGKRESGLGALMSFLKKSRYTCDAGVLRGSRYGVPQSRRRFVLIASRVSKVKIPGEDEDMAVVKNAIGKESGLAEIAAGAPPPAGDSFHRSPSLSEKNIARLELTPPGGLREHWAHREDLMIRAYKGKSTLFPNNYGRMAWDEPAPTLTTQFYTLGCGRFGHPEQNRAISLREGALLQTFPHKYQFKTKSFAATAKLIGNAVPPELARRIGAYLVKQAARHG